MPVVSFLVVVADEATDLASFLSSLDRQADDAWELVLYGPGAEGAAASAGVSTSGRLVVIAAGGSPTAQLRAACDAASGLITCLLDATALLDPQTVTLLTAALVDDPEVDVLYGDEGVMDASGEFVEVVCRPVWSPERLRGQNYLEHFVCVRRELLDEVLGTPGSPTEAVVGHDLVLKVTERARDVIRIPEVLASRPADIGGVDDERWAASVTAAQQQADRLGWDAVAVRGGAPGTVRLLAEPVADTRVTVVIPTRGGRGLVRGERRRYVVELVRSLLSDPGLDGVEVAVVYEPSCPARVLDELRVVAGGHLALVPFGRPFAAAAMSNRGVVATNSDTVVLLDERTEVCSEQFLRRLIAPLSHPGVGLVGPMLTATNGSVTSAGVAVFANRLTRMYQGVFEDQAGQALEVDREVSALDGRCLAIRRSTLEQVGGLNEGLDTLWSVDLSLKVADLGLSRVWVRSAELHELAMARDPLWPDPEERRQLFLRWSAPDSDPYEPGYGRRLLHRRRHDRTRWARSV